MPEAEADASQSSPGSGSARSRVHRDDPERSEPIRNWWTFFRAAEGNSGNRRPEPGERQSRNWCDVVDRGVRLGYGVIDDQIRQGQRVAQEINDRSYGIDSMNRDLQELAVRSMRYYVDVAMVFMDLLATIPSTLEVATRPFRQPGTGAFGSDKRAGSGPNGATAAGGPTPDAGSGSEVSIRLVSVREATATLDLRPGSSAHGLTMPGLYAAGKEKPPITAINFEPATSDYPPVLQVEVPEDQPPGLYSGVVFDEQTGEPLGTLSVHVAA